MKYLIDTRYRSLGRWELNQHKARVGMKEAKLDFVEAQESVFGWGDLVFHGGGDAGRAVAADSTEEKEGT